MKKESRSLAFTAGKTNGLLSPHGDRVEWSLTAEAVELPMAEQTLTSNMFPNARLIHGDCGSSGLTLLETAFSETLFWLCLSESMSKNLRVS